MSTLYLKPKDEPSGSILRLYKAIEEAFPHCNDLSTISPNGFQPHLTVGQFPTSSIAKTIERFSKANKVAPFTFLLEQIHLISRSGENPFEIKHSFSLGGKEYLLQLYLTCSKPKVALNKTTKIDENVFTVGDESKVVEKISDWIWKRKRQQGGSCLPKTLDKLMNSIGRMCEINCFIDPEVVYNVLVEYDYVLEQLQPDGDRTVTSTLSRGQPIPLPSLPLNMQNEWKAIMDKVMQWMNQTRLPNTYGGYISSLSQFCRYKRKVAPDYVIERLVEQKIIRLGEEDVVEYLT